MNMGTQDTQTTPEATSSMNGGEKSTGSIVGAIIVVIIIILGGFYFWGQKLDTNGTDDMMATSTEEVADLEADLTDADLMAQDLEADLAGVEAELAQ